MKRAILVLLATVGLATPVAAQLAGEQIPAGRTTPVAEAVKLEMEKSRYRFGALRVQPVLALRDLGYQGNVFATSGSEVGDWRSTVAAGARMILPVGPKVFLRATAIPEYTWYRKLVEHRRFGGQYSASALALFNRMSVEATIRPVRTVARVSSENERTLPTTTVHAFARAEVEPLRRLIFFVSDESLRTRYDFPQDEPESGRAVERLERNETSARGGVRYKFKPYFSVGAAVEFNESTFVQNGERSNTSNAVILDFRYDRPRTFLNIAMASRRGEATSSASIDPFPEYSLMTGSYSLQHRLAAPVAVDVFGRRSVTYSSDSASAYFVENRNGVALSFPWTRHATFRFSGEMGSNAYPVKTNGGVARSDKVRTYLGGVAVRIYQNVVLSTVVSSTNYDSNVSGLDRTLFTVTSTVIFSVSGDLFDELR